LDNQNLNCGVIGLGYASSVWNVFPTNDVDIVPNVLMQFSNLTDWTWAADGYVQPSNFSNNLTLGLE
jgi:hypothetical protein